MTGDTKPAPVCVSSTNNNDQQQNHPSANNSSQVQLKRTLGLRDGIAIIMGIIIGSGIFVSPKGVLNQAGSVGASLLVWALCGLLSMLGALCFAELGTSIAASGGEYTYIRLAYGPLASFLYLWVTVTILLPCSSAITALTFANYVLQPLYVNCDLPPDEALRFLALALLMILIYVNCASVNAALKVQGAFTVAKVMALALIIGAGSYRFATGRSENLQSSEAFWTNTQASLPMLAQAFYASFYTYAGWSALNCVTEEMKNPAKTMPRAIIISISSITIIYILTNIAYFAVLSRQEILSSDAIAVLFGERVFSPGLRWLMPMAVVLSTIGGLNGGIFTFSRVLFAGARQGQLFESLQMISLKQLTPVPALLFLGIMSSIYLVTTKIQILINYMGFVEAIFAALSVSTVLRLRYKWPTLPRPLKIYTFVPILYLLFSALLIILPVWTSPVEAAIGTAITLSGIPVYYLTARWQRKPKGYQRFIHSLNKFTQKITMSVAPDGDVPILAS